MAATSVSVTVLHSLLQCHSTGCWPLLPSYSELLISLARNYSYTSAICHQWEVHRLSEHAESRHTACKVPCNSKKISKHEFQALSQEKRSE